jgi:hypothetical protein
MRRPAATRENVSSLRDRSRCAQDRPEVKDGAGGSYHWVECGACDTAWQALYYAESVG